MEMYARLDMAAPRETHARLFVNNEYVGLFVVVEEIDRAFVARVFGEAEARAETGGYLYKDRWVSPWGFQSLGDGLDRYAQVFTPKTHETDSIASLFAPIR